MFSAGNKPTPPRYVFDEASAARFASWTSASATRTQTGAPNSSRQRLKEEAAYNTVYPGMGVHAHNFLLQCAICEHKVGDVLGNLTLGTIDFDIDHPTEEEDSPTADDTYLGRVASMKNGHSQFLCALCHRRKSSTENMRKVYRGGEYD